MRNVILKVALAFKALFMPLEIILEIEYNWSWKAGYYPAFQTLI